MFPLDTMERLNREAEARHFATRPGWHPVDSCMPTVAFQDVLLIVDGIVRMGYRVESVFYDSSRHTPFEGKVTHWHPVPELPCLPESVPF